jgi:hypothetical protein
VLPYPPRAEQLAYVTGLTGTDPDSLTVLCPPPGALGTDLLTPDRTDDPEFRARVRAVVRERGVDQVLAVYKDVPVTRFAGAVGLRVPGHAFSAQGGDAFLNSKACFRAVAAGVGAPIVEGLATTRSTEASELVTELLAAGHCAIVKREFAAGGQGNEILSPVAGVRVAGAPSAVVLPDAAAVTGYFARRWDWLTDGGRHRVVLERYLTGCDSVYSEFIIGDDGPQLSGVGEMLMAPVPTGEIAPAQVSPAVRTILVEAGLRLSEAYHAMGYRGYLSADAVLTPDGEIFFTETNARMSGSSHLHVVVHRQLLAGRSGRRVALELQNWAVPSYSGAIARLSDSGLAFDKSTGLGVLLISGLLPDQTVTYCVVAESIRSARAVQAQLATLFTEAEAVPVATRTAQPAEFENSS